MNKTLNQNGETNTETNIQFEYEYNTPQDKANELQMWIDSEQVYNDIQGAWAKNYAKKIKKGVFDMDKALKGMDNFARTVNDMRNKKVGIDDEGRTPHYIKITKEDKPTIRKVLLEGVLYRILDNDEIRQDTTDLIKQLENIQ